MVSLLEGCKDFILFKVIELGASKENRTLEEIC